MPKPTPRDDPPEPRPYRVRLTRHAFTVEPRPLLLGDDLQRHPFIKAAHMSNLTRRRLALEAENAWSIDGDGRFLPPGIVAIMAWFRLDRAGLGVFLPEREGGKVLPYQIDTILVLRTGQYVLGLPRTTAAVMGCVMETVEIVTPTETFDERDAGSLGTL